MTTSSEPIKENNLPNALVSELQSALKGEKTSNGVGGEARVGDGTDPLPAEEEERRDFSSSPDPAELAARSKPLLLLTNADGISSPGLISLVDALFLGGLYDIHVCAPDLDKSASGHSVTLRETLAVSSAEINGATAFQVSGTPVDCVSLALSGVLFPWSRPALVISGINKGSTCGHHIFYSGAVAGPREALMCGIPSHSISLNWDSRLPNRAFVDLLQLGKLFQLTGILLASICLCTKALVFSLHSSAVMLLQQALLVASTPTGRM